MENYIKAVNESCIRWVKKMGDCLEVCTKTTGCNTHPKYKDTHTICKLHAYNKLNKHFE